MSIHDLINKIKRNNDLDNISLIYLLIIILVSISSFYLGKISVDSSKLDEKYNENTEPQQKEETYDINPLSKVEEKKYVASKNGKMYYSPGCNGAKRIKKENEVWFGSKEDAEKSGYVLSGSCK